MNKLTMGHVEMYLQSGILYTSHQLEKKEAPVKYEPACAVELAAKFIYGRPDTGHIFFDQMKRRFTSITFDVKGEDVLEIVYDEDVSELSTRLSVVREYISIFDEDEFKIIRERVLFSPEMNEYLEIFWPAETHFSDHSKSMKIERALGALIAKEAFDHISELGIDKQSLSAIYHNLREKKQN